MKLDVKIYLALLDLLSSNQPISKKSLCRKAGINRSSLYNRLKKHNQFIDVEVL